jgi:hypothetical protein
MTASDRFTAIRAGRDAAASGYPVTTCPHPTHGDDAALATAWVRGFASHPIASGRVDYSS